MVAMAELLSVMPEDHPDRAKVLEIFQRGARGAAETQGGTGLWHQLLDRTDSYLETSASAMFTFAIARGVNRGWLPPSYAPVAQTGLARPRAARPPGRPDRGHLRRHHRRLRRRVLLQSADRPQRDAGIRARR